VRSRELVGLEAFLRAVSARVRMATDLDVDLLVDVTTQSPPRRFIGAAPAVAERALLSPHELDVLARTPSGPDDDWLVLAICAYARNGVEIDVLEELCAQRPQLHLAGTTTALIHGTVVIFVLAHGPAGSLHPGASPALVFPEAQVLVCEPATIPELTRFPAGRVGSLLQLHIVCADRPGTFASLLERLEQELVAAMGLPATALAPSVIYTLTDVEDGRLAISRVMVRLALAAEHEDRLRQVSLDDVAHHLRRHLLTPAPGPLGGAGWQAVRAAVSLNLVYGPRAAIDPDRQIQLPADVPPRPVGPAREIPPNRP
jgi:hypothetical protein